MSNLDTFSFILTTKHSFLDDLDPVISTRFSIGAEVPLLVGGEDFEMILVLEGDFDRSAIMSRRLDNVSSG